MKQLLVCLSIIVLVSALLSFGGPGEKIKLSSSVSAADTVDAKREYPVKMVIANWDRFYQGLGIAASELRQSDRPSKNVAFVIDSVIFPLQQQILSQLQKQFNADSSGKKPK